MLQLVTRPLLLQLGETHLWNVLHWSGCTLLLRGVMDRGLQGLVGCKQAALDCARGQPQADGASREMRRCSGSGCAAAWPCGLKNPHDKS